jgi:hypothetical protein
VREGQNQNATKRGSTEAIGTANQWIINEPNSIPLIGSCHQKVKGHCCRPMFGIPIPRAPDPKKVIKRCGGALGVALVWTRAFVQMLDRAWLYQLLVAVDESKPRIPHSTNRTFSPSRFHRELKSRTRDASDGLFGEKSGTSGGTKDEAGCTGDRHNGS